MGLQDIHMIELYCRFQRTGACGFLHRDSSVIPSFQHQDKLCHKNKKFGS